MTEEIVKLRHELQIAQETIKIKDQRVTQLNAEVQELRAQVAKLQKVRPKLAPENLITPFRSALIKMQEGLDLGEGRVNYVIGRFDTDLRVAVVLDDEGNLAFQLPELEDVVPFQNLSQLSLSLVPVGTPPTLPPQTAKVPNLLGMSRAAAAETIENALSMGRLATRVGGSARPRGRSPERGPLPPHCRSLCAASSSRPVSNTSPAKD